MKGCSWQCSLWWKCCLGSLYLDSVVMNQLNSNWIGNDERQVQVWKIILSWLLWHHSKSAKKHKLCNETFVSNKTWENLRLTAKQCASWSTNGVHWGLCVWTFKATLLPKVPSKSSWRHRSSESTCSFNSTYLSFSLSYFPGYIPLHSLSIV